MRLPVLFAALAIAAPIGFCAGSASAQFFQDQSVLFGRRHAYEGRWCANQNVGGRIDENCTFDSFEACRRLVISGNRGFCTQNPGYAGPPPAPVRKNKKKRRKS